ncbi:MAG: glycosyltransferase [Deltaproteobacteria bacterium]|nr:glycosyltransferase [Deltaproteobacteria bacterium]
MDSLRILFVSPYVPSLLRTRPFGFVTQLARRGHRITLLSAETSEQDHDAVAALRSVCERIEVVPISRLRASLNCLRGLTDDLPFQALYCHSPAWRERLRDLLAANTYDIAHVEHLRAALMGVDLRGLPRVYDAVDCISELFEITQHHGGTWLSRTAARIDLPRTRRFEARLTQSFERIIVTAESEAAALSRLSPSQEVTTTAQVVPNGVDLEYFRPFDGRREAATLLYVGRMSYHANVRAAVELVRKVMPIVWASRPDARVVICGAEPVRAVRALAGGGESRITVTGTVADVRPYLQRATLSVNPLPYAVGIQNKVLEALATATPVVASPAACAGLAKGYDQVLIETSGVQSCAGQILRLLADDALRRRMGAAGRKYVEAYHDWNFTTQRLEAVYRDAVSSFSMKGPLGDER